MGTCYQLKMRLLPVIAMIKVEIIATSLSQILIAQVQGQAQQMLSLELRWASSTSRLRIVEMNPVIHRVVQSSQDTYVYTSV